MRSIKLPNLDSDFFKNALKLASGNSLTQFVSLAAWPILARVYDPVSIAFYNVLLTFGILCANLSTLQYYQTILLAKERKEAERLVVTCLVNTAIVTTVVFCLIMVLHSALAQWLNIAKWLSMPSESWWFTSAALIVLLEGITQTLTLWSNRNQNYGLIARVRVIGTIVNVVTAISIGLLFDKPPHWGIIFGYMLGALTSAIVLIYNVYNKEELRFKLHINKENYTELMRKYKNIPYYSLPSELISVLNFQLPIFLLSKFSLPISVASYAFCNRVLSMPATVVSFAVGDVFKSRSNQDFHETGSCKEIFMRTFKNLALINIAGFTLIFIFAPWFFEFFFGEKFARAGEYARILCVFYALHSTIAPISYVLYVRGRQKWDFIRSAYSLISNFAILYYFFGYRWDVIYGLAFYSLNSLIIFGLLFLASYYSTSNNAADTSLKEEFKLRRQKA